MEVETEDQTQGDHPNQAEEEQNPVNRKDEQDDHFEREHNFLDFENILLDVRLRKAILYLFKYKYPTKIQKEAIPHILHGKDVIISSKTGSGKTMAYLIPLVQNILKSNINEKESLKFFYKGIILAPTEELCLQIHQVAQTLSSYVKNMLSFDHNINRTFYDHPTVLVTTPRHLYNHTVECKKKYNLDILSNLKILVVDEADILHSKEFQKWMNLLASYHLPKNYSKKYQIVMASATLKETIVEKTKLFLHDPVFLSAELDKSISPSTCTSANVDYPDGHHSKDSSNRDSTNVPLRSGKLSDSSEPSQLKEPLLHHQFRGKSFWYFYPDETTKYIYLYNLINDKIILRKSIIFTSTIHDAYKIKIFLTYFDIPSSILNPNHPILVRQNIIFAFNNYKIFFLICPQYEKNSAGRGGKADMSDMGDTGDTASVHSGGDTDDMDLSINHDSIPHDVDTDETGHGEEDTCNQDIASLDQDDACEQNDTCEQDEACEKDDACEEDEAGLDQDDASNFDDHSSDEKDFLYNRGLDFQGVHCVVNFDMPLDTKTFVHRVGRTCRLNNKGISISFINENKSAEKNILQKICAKNICTISQRTVSQKKVEMYRYRVESMLSKCTNKRVKQFIQKEILYQSLKSKELKEFFNSNEEEKRAINKVVKYFNTHVVPHKLIKDRLKNLFLKKEKKKGVQKKGINKNGNESANIRMDRKNRHHNGKSNRREDEKGGAQQHYVKSKSNGFVITEQAYEDQLRKEPEAEVADPTKLPPIYGKRLRNYVYSKYVIGKRRMGGRANSGRNNNGGTRNGGTTGGRSNGGRSNVSGSHRRTTHNGKPNGGNFAHKNRRHGSATTQKA
ncbi:DEAD/DEAH box ATP-dependent RNA helicase, putative [Plasmodium knowlesi strain H]|uniref:DEAD/DEAH box ATP-dependent RNA helicase, putative n=3 Tax=Plasmodium knowlesi TaxID=5850 RepID=A0A5K1UP54_PLAKH|nr:ATP-dependent RNA helicase DBP9, putative [Plasmodium knowlesi strain H]OTN64182.1 putative DEAD/DEAH box ATP-dependent RNA helicase [Plasmodium knowlesi]CAA9991208.1 ATP-dependent RNA helicase DBP9, putative [Plasmodium knowlesi strain H]SBO26269.1 DEAD/DEAH box ATP-dependent RNA helicase, putative [Plasmodium knowlesi strain H]SBO29591.1 DEAD/DEAH box ATP-dependent RNA helicase, putative [Plasmodium knowlesi strain H]VVS80682.1 ATP-dependent RNA helicase DBP9, putative [Plasmodium knowles|eukprot:XP_002262491.1 dead/deah box helicase, putative [Plasmodium knowlesi strain H]